MSAPLPSSPRIGLVGLGVMGAPIALRLCDVGYAVTAWNLEPERFALVRDAGVIWAASPAAVWAASDVGLLCVLGDDAIDSVCFGPRGFASAERGAGARLLIDLSTTSPEKTREAGPRLHSETGADWIDAPMSGGPAAARDGALTLMIGGAEESCAAAEAVLGAMAANVTRMGDLGAGQVAKILNQAVVGVNYVLMAELLATAEAAKIDPSLLPGCLAGGMADSTILQRILPQMAARDFDPPRGYARQLAKDLKAVQAFVAAHGLDLPIVEQGAARFRAYADDGNDLADSASVMRLYEKKDD